MTTSCTAGRWRNTVNVDDKIKWIGEVESAETFESGDAIELGAVLHSPALIKALGMMARIPQLLPENFAALDLSKEAGLHDAIRLQGKIDGIVYVIEVGPKAAILFCLMVGYVMAVWYLAIARRKDD